MRRLIVVAMGVSLVFAPMSGCKKKRKAPTVDASKESPAEPATMLGTADPRATVQLTKGFYEVENGGWRWSSKEFSAALKPPSTAADKGATLVLRFSVVDASIAKLGALSLTAKVGATACPAQKYEKAGTFEFKCAIPGADLKSPMAAADFALDKVLPRTDDDQRELGLVVMMIGFEAK